MRVRRNGFVVLIPKYGLKGNGELLLLHYFFVGLDFGYMMTYCSLRDTIVYVRDKDGKSLIPSDGLRLPNVQSTLS